jgi:hypothetical protein
MRASSKMSGGLAVAVLLGSVALAAQAPPAQGRGARPFVAIGCVSRQAPAGRGGAPVYIVTDPRGAKPTQYRLEADLKKFDLDFHVGHIVEVSGPLASGTGMNTMTVE